MQDKNLVHIENRVSKPVLRAEDTTTEMYLLLNETMTSNKYRYNRVKSIQSSFTINIACKGRQNLFFKILPNSHFHKYPNK